MKRISLALAVALLCVAGCVHERASVMSSVGGEMRQIKTRNRYTLAGFKHQAQNANADVVKENVYTPPFSNDTLKRYQPDVFADDGIRFMMHSSASPRECDSYSWTTYFPFLLTLMIMPQCRTILSGSRCTVDVLDNPDARATLDECSRSDHAGALTPTPFLFYLGDATPPEGSETYSVYSRHWISTAFFSLGENPSAQRESLDVLRAYAIAATLKKMEDDGLIDESRSRLAGRDSAQTLSIADKFEVVDFRREGDDGCRHSFMLRRRDGGGISLRDSREAQKMLKTMIREDYGSSFPAVAVGELVVEFPEFSLRNGTIRGKSEVLSLAVESLRYDSRTRTGVLRVRIGANQFEAARKYAIRNIESLVRDKNIALDGRDIPPASTFFLQGESLKGDVLEITFRTE